MYAHTRSSSIRPASFALALSTLVGAAMFAVAMVLLTGVITVHADEPVPANVHITWDTSWGPSAGVGQTWAEFYRLSAANVYTSTVPPALEILKARQPDHTVPVVADGSHLGGSGIVPGDYAIVLSNGGVAHLFGKVVTVNSGDQYPGFTDVITWTGPMTSGGSAKSTGAAPATKAVSVQPGTPMCRPVPMADGKFAQTGGVAKLMVTAMEPFTRTLALVLAFKGPGKPLVTMELARRNIARDSSVVVVNLAEILNKTTGKVVPLQPGTTVDIPSGAYHVFRQGPEALEYLGFLNASAGSTLTELDVPATLCQRFSAKEAMAETGGGLPWQTSLAVLLGGLAILAFGLHRRFVWREIGA